MTWLTWFDSIVRDVRLGARMLRKQALLQAAAAGSLALAIGACVAAFSLVDALILRPLPVVDPQRLIALSFPTYTPERPESDTFNDPLFVRLRDGARDQVSLFAMSTQVMRPAIFDGSGDKELVRTQFVSGDAFDQLGIRAARGRLIAPADDAPPGAVAGVLSHAFWQRRFGGDAAVLGRWFALESRQVQIVGIAEAGFAGVEPGRPTDVWLPYITYDQRAIGNAEFNWFRILGRVKPATTQTAVQSALQAAFTTFRRDRAAQSGPRGTPADLARFVAAPLYVRSAANGPSPLRRQFERSLWILAATAGLILLIAGSNLANLYLARAAVREREMAVRLSIGAGRGRLIQQLLIESGIVGALACAAGLVVAAASTPFLVGMLASPDDPVQLDLRLSSGAFAVAAGLALMSTLIFGLAPAWRASRVSPITTVNARGDRAGSRAGVMRPFVAVQVAFGLVVLVVGSLLVLSFARLSRVDPGFAAGGVLLVDLEPTGRLTATEQRVAILGILDQLRADPGVLSASVAEFNPIGRAWTTYLRGPRHPQDQIEATMFPVSDGYFETMNVRVLAGRTFARTDMDMRTPVIVVNEAFAKRYVDTAPPVGTVVKGRFGGQDDTASESIVVGVVADTRYDLRQPAAPTIYFPIRSAGTLQLRIAGTTVAAGVRVRDEVRRADPRLRVTSVSSQAAAIDRTLVRERLLAVLSSFFGGVGLVLVAVGLYGVLSYAVVHRTREIGIRMALGARPWPVVRTIVADVGAAVIVGVAFGVAAGLYLSRFVEALLFEVRPSDALSSALPIGIFLLAATLAAALPAWRAARIEPIIALRCD